ncbi:MAG: S8 family serine peptidase [Acidobacteriota bacterium]|nr:S8 family serine peptidase [Acidobacteriota bacterium]
MNTKVLGLSVCLAVGVALAISEWSVGVSAQAGPAAPYIVVLQDDGSDVTSIANDHARAYGLSVQRLYRSALRGYAAVIPLARLDDVRNDATVRFVSEDRPVFAVAQNIPTGIDRIEADTSSQSSGNGAGAVNGLAVAVIDTGSGPHADLNVVGGFNCSTGPSYNDGNGHGTHVAGTIGAKDDSNGVVGVAPGVRIYSVRVLNNAGSGFWSSVACGIDWVTANAASLGIRVANMSLGGSGSDDGNCGQSNNDALHLALCNSVAAGITYVVAAGNSGADFSGFVPAAYDEVLTVTAMADFNGLPGGGAAATCRTDVDETPADFSNFTTVGSGDEGHTIAAPGVCIESTWKGGGYKTISGTSMASPHVTGAAALCLALGQCFGTPAEVIATLRGDAAAQAGPYGFVGDPENPITTGGRFPKMLYYGYLVFAGGY